MNTKQTAIPSGNTNTFGGFNLKKEWIDLFLALHGPIGPVMQSPGAPPLPRGGFELESGVQIVPTWDRDLLTAIHAACVDCKHVITFNDYYVSIEIDCTTAIDPHKTALALDL